MADDYRLDIRAYCSKCDSYRPIKAFSTGDTWCKECRTQNVSNYIRNHHDRAIHALGGQCMSCNLPYDPDNRKETQMHMMKLPGFDDWMGFPACQYQYSRDKRVQEEPEVAKKYIRMLCRSCRPKFERVRTP